MTDERPDRDKCGSIVDGTTRQQSASRDNERGAARLNFAIIAAVIAITVYAASQYLPVMYNATLLKDLMNNRVENAAVLGRPADWVTNEIKRGAPELGVPPNAVIQTLQRDGRLESRVTFTTPIKFPGFTYEYKFDHTARSSTFSAGSPTS